MKILIASIEKLIPYKIKRNFCSIGFDTATTTGLCILKTDKEFLYLDPIVISFKTENMKERYNSAVKMFEKLVEDNMYVIVEDVYQGPNPKVTLYLARLGGFALSIAVRKGLNYETISASSARAKFKINTKKYGKGKSKQAVADWIKSLGVEITDNNIADGFVLALLGMCENMDFRSAEAIKQEKKVKRARK